MKLLFIFGLVILSFFNALAQEERFVNPFDEANKDASFLAFRTKLLEASKKRDMKYVLSIVDPNIRNTFGDDDGIRYFKKTWKIDRTDSKFWDEFLPVITNGGKFTREGKTMIFSAPYTYTGMSDDLDPFEHQVIFGDNVNLRAQADLRAETVARLSYNVVKVDYVSSVKIGDDKSEYSWLKIETLGGKKGFVKAEFVRSPIDYRAIFEKKSGRWKMTAFIAGD